MSPSVVVELKQEISASKEAYFSWEITLPSGITFKKGMLYLTDIDQDADPDSKIFKYQLHSTESPAGSHIFEVSHVGNYYARLTIIGSDDSINVSELKTVKVYELGAASIYSVASRDSGFTIMLNPYTSPALQSDQSISTVNFVLFGREKTSTGYGAGSVSINIAQPYKDIDDINYNEYIIEGDSENQITNGWQYEIACFYTDDKVVSGDLSDTFVSTPTDKPNQITNLSAEYDYPNKKLLINYSNPTDYGLWEALTLRATITYVNTTTNTNDYIFDADSPNFTFDGEQIEFDINSLPKLPIDISFNITLNISNTFGYADFESEAITCIVPERFCSEPATITDINYIVGDGTFSVTYNTSTLSKYDVSVYVIVTDFVSGDLAYDDYYQSGVGINVDNGSRYTVQLQAFYTAELDSDIVIGPSTEDIHHHDYNFIPHGQANAPEFLDIEYEDGTARLSWSEPTDLRGYDIDHYELSNDDGASWFSVDQDTTYLISCGPNYTSGAEYKFKVKAFTKSPDTEFDDGEEIKEGTASSSINVYPLEKPLALTVNQHIPGDETCDIKFTVNDTKGGSIHKFNYVINNGTSTEMSASKIGNTFQYSYLFEGLDNSQTYVIYISVVTSSGNNTQESQLVNFTTNPYKMPVVPTLSAKPNTTSVELSWPANNPNEILTYTVEYDVEYKVSAQGSEWIPSSENYTLNTQTNIYTLNIPTLTSNTEYKFHIRSKIFNDELFDQGIEPTKTSEYSTEITSRPFVYRNKPTMNLRVDNKKIIVELTRSTGNFYGPHAYHATVARSDNVSNILKTIDVITSDISQTLTFDMLQENVTLVNLELYTVFAWYDMVINESYTTTTVPYESDKETNATVIPFDPAIVPILACTPYNGKINLSWNDGNMNRLTITKYQVSSKLNTDLVWSDFTDFTPGISDADAQNTDNYNIDMPQDNGVLKDYKIQAVISDAGNTYFSVSNTVTVKPFDFADAPILDSYVSSSEKIILNWLALSTEELNGLPLLRYEVKKTGDTQWTPLDDTLLTHEFSGLTNGQLYTFYVRAVTNNSINSANLGYVNEIVSTNQLSQTARPYADPTITLDSVVSTNATTLTLNWTPYLGGRNLDHYEIYYNTESSTTTSSNKYYEISSLTTGTAYECSVKIYVIDQNDNAPKDENGINLLVYTQSLLKTNIPYLPAIAPNIVSSVPDDKFVDVTWDNLTTEQLKGLPLKHYQVNYKVKNTSSYILSTWQIIPSGDLSYRFNGLTNGTEYTFYVQAVTTNEYYDSDTAIITDEVIGANSVGENNIPYLPLAAPSSVTCEPGPSRAILNWSEPEFIGLELLYYEVTGGNLIEPAKIYSPNTSYLCEGLSNNTRYYFNVKAVASHEYITDSISSDDSTQVSTIPYQMPDTVADVVCSAVNGTLTINFINPSTSTVNNGLTQYYHYTLNNGGYNDVYPGESIDISSFGNTDITVRVFSRINNPNNQNFVYSYASTVVVSNSNLVSDIQNLTASPGDKSVTLKWENVNSTSGSTYGIVQITDAGSKSLLKTLTFSSGQPLTTTITSLADGSLLVNGKSYTFHVYASTDDVLKISATPIGAPIFNSLTNSGSAFTTDIDLNGSTRVDVSIVAIEISGAVDIIYTSFTTRVNTIQYNISNTYTSAFVLASNSVGPTRSSQIIF